MRSLMLALFAPVLLIAATPDGADWPTFRGPNHDGHSPDTGLLKEWPSGGPPIAWKTKGVGLGATSVIVTGGKVITTGDLDKKCHLMAFNEGDGKLIWTTEMGSEYIDPKPWLHGPRAVPSTDGSLVIATNPQGDVLCADVATGKEKWRKHLMKDFGGEVTTWLYSDSPLIDGDNVVFICGGPKGSVVALKKATGELVWQSAEITDKAEYTSLCPAVIGGKPQYILMTMTTVAGISAADGKVLWRIARPGKVAVIPTPIYKDGYIFTTSGYGVGCFIYKIGADFKIEEVYSDAKAGIKEKDRTANHHGGMILLGDYVYGTNEKGFCCVEFKTGKVVWENKSVGKASVVYADGHFVVRGENRPQPGPKTAEVALIEATPTGYKENGRFTPPDLSGKETWAHPVVIGGKLYLRDHDVLLCYDVKAK